MWEIHLDIRYDCNYISFRMLSEIKYRAKNFVCKFKLYFVRNIFWHIGKKIDASLEFYQIIYSFSISALDI